MYTVRPELEGVGALTDSHLIIAMTGNARDRWDCFGYDEVDVVWGGTTVTIEPRGLILSFDKAFFRTFAEDVLAAGGRTLKM